MFTFYIIYIICGNRVKIRYLVNLGLVQTSLQSASELLFLNHIMRLGIKCTYCFKTKSQAGGGMELHLDCWGLGYQEKSKILYKWFCFLNIRYMYLLWLASLIKASISLTTCSDCYYNVLFKRQEAGRVSQWISIWQCVLSIYGKGVWGLKYYHFKPDLII